MIDRIKNESDIDFALAELKKLDPKLVPIIDKVNEVPLRLAENSIEGLAKIVTSQLISRAAATSIWTRIEAEFGEITEDKILQSDEDHLMTLGLSRAKASTFIGIALASSKGVINFDEINHMQTDKALKKLMSLKGVGRWTAEVYLMFCCGHRDLFPSGDIALRVAAGDIFDNRDRFKEGELGLLAERWSPYRSVAARLLWSHYAAMKDREILPL